MARDWRDDRIAEQAATIAELRGMVAGLRERVAKLEEQARRSSRNSSQAPSSDGPGAPPARKKGPSGRSPGGQEGHDQHVRPLVPADKVHKRVVLRPERCRGCRAVLVSEDSSRTRARRTTARFRST